MFGKKNVMWSEHFLKSFDFFHLWPELFPVAWTMAYADC